MKENIIKNKSFSFALRIVKLCGFIQESRKEYVLSKQLLKSGTSIGANVREAEHAQSDADFVHKLSVALKEANETEYWLELLFKADYLTEQQYDSIQADCAEVNKILISIIKTTKQKPK